MGVESYTFVLTEKPQGGLKMKSEVKKGFFFRLTYYRSRMWRKTVLKCIINQTFLANNHSGTQSVTFRVSDIFK